MAGWAGHKMGGGKMGAVAGAAVGAIGANMLENKFGYATLSLLPCPHDPSSGFLTNSGREPRVQQARQEEAQEEQGGEADEENEEEARPRPSWWW